MKSRKLLVLATALLLSACGTNTYTTDTGESIVEIYVETIRNYDGYNAENSKVVDFYSWQFASYTKGHTDWQESYEKLTDTMLITTYNTEYYTKSSWYCGKLETEPKVFLLEIVRY